MPLTTKSGEDDAKKENEFGELNLGEKPGELLTPEKEKVEKNDALQAHEADEQKVLREQIEAMPVDDGIAKQTTQTAQNLTSTAPKERIRKLLLIAEQKGVVYAVNVAKKMDDPYLLDVFHDALVEKGFYKKFKK